MMGQEVLDPEHVEGDIERLPGLGLLPISTRMSGEKVTRQVKFGLCNPHSPSSPLHSPFMQGYEIHMGAVSYTHLACSTERQSSIDQYLYPHCQHLRPYVGQRSTH